MSAITATDTTISLDNANGFPGAGTILIGAEQIAYTDKFGNTLLNVRRGVNGTVAVAHASGAVAAFLSPNVPTPPPPTATSVPRDVVYRAIGDGSGCSIDGGSTATSPPIVLLVGMLLWAARRRRSS